MEKGLCSVALQITDNIFDRPGKRKTSQWQSLVGLSVKRSKAADHVGSSLSKDTKMVRNSGNQMLNIAIPLQILHDLGH